MKIKALKSFCGTVTMSIGEVKDVNDDMALNFIGAGYAQPVEEQAETHKETVPPDEAALSAETEQPPKKSTKKATKNETK